MRASIALCGLLFLGACAGAPGAGGDTYSTQLDRLAADCRERGGILAPTGTQSGRPQTDNVCKISGGASRLTPDRSN